MDTHDVLVALAEWAVAECDPPINGTYPYLPSAKEQQLPDIVVQVFEKLLNRDDPRFPIAQIQQAWIRVWECSMSIMVANDDPSAAAETLENYADQLEAALIKDGSLGSRVPFASPYLAFDFTAPYVEYPDGTRGREMNVTIHVGELVEAPQ